MKSKRTPEEEKAIHREHLAKSLGGGHFQKLERV